MDEYDISLYILMKSTCISWHDRYPTFQDVFRGSTTSLQMHMRVLYSICICQLVCTKMSMILIGHMFFDDYRHMRGPSPEQRTERPWIHKSDA